MASKPKSLGPDAVKAHPAMGLPSGKPFNASKVKAKDLQAAKDAMPITRKGDVVTGNAVNSGVLGAKHQPVSGWPKSMG